jgi:hypothetical protein
MALKREDQQLCDRINRLDAEIPAAALQLPSSKRSCEV